MTDSDRLLSDLLERASRHATAGRPPLDEIVAGARRRSRRRTMLLTATSAAALGAAVAATAVLSPLGSDPERTPGLATSVSPSSPTPADPIPSTDLEGTWRVMELVGTNGESVLPASAQGEVELTFTDGELTGTTGCNDVFGTYLQSGDNGKELRFPRKQLGSTLVGCADEPPLVPRLLDVRYVSGRAGVRYLHAENRMIVVELRR